MPTDANGYYTYSNLTPGAYSVGFGGLPAGYLFDPYGYGTYSQTTSVMSNSTATINATAFQTMYGLSVFGLNGGVENASLSGVLATFADPDFPFDGATATIAWGDGAADTGTIALGAGNLYTVSGTHTYAEDQTYTQTVTITDIYGDVLTGNVTITVTDAPLLSVSAGASYAEGTSVSGQIAAFHDDAGDGEDQEAGEYTITINWGDGSGPDTTSGSISPLGNGDYAVIASHAYTGDGPYSFSVTVLDDGGQSVTLDGTASAIDAPLTDGTGATVTAVEATPFTSQYLGSFTDTAADAGQGNDSYSVSIDWGDGSDPDTSSGTVTYPNVYGAHTYLEPGTYTVIATITDNEGGQYTTVTGSATVSDAPLQAGSPAVSFNGQEPFTIGNQSVATFSDAGGDDGGDDSYSATIDWGDGSPLDTSATVTYPNVYGTHTYEDEGNCRPHFETGPVLRYGKGPG